MPSFLEINRLIAAFLLLPGLQAVFGAEVIDPTTDLATDPIGISDTAPRFSWKIKPDPAVRGLAQTAYEIEMTRDGAPLWDSGKVVSAAQVLVEAPGLTIHPLSQYEWRVKIWDDKGVEGPFSEPATFGTGRGRRKTGIPAGPSGSSHPSRRIAAKRSTNASSSPPSLLTRTTSRTSHPRCSRRPRFNIGNSSIRKWSASSPLLFSEGNLP